jgi:Leu/Phe-tRNA-protein transferase
MNKFQIRQGDVLVMEAEKPKGDAKLTPVETEGGRTILAHGEVTGHAHALAGTEATLFSMFGSEDPFLEVNVEQAYLRHEEHSALHIPKGTHRVVRQREYRYGTAERVAD